MALAIDLQSPPVDVNAPLDERDIQLVQASFAHVARLGAKNVGKLLFMNIFKVAPGAVDLFPFARGEANLYRPGGNLELHALKLMETVATAVSMLRELDQLVPILEGLGLQHAGFGVQATHYDLVGIALISTLEVVLGRQFTEPVKHAFMKVWKLIKETMLSQEPPSTVLKGLQYDVNESMDFDMFRQVMRNPGVRACFDAVDICLDLSEEQLFSIIDENGDGELSFDEFFQSLWRLRGSKERLHSLLVQADIVHTHRRLKDRMVQLTEDLEDYHREECAELREQLESRVQAMVDGLEAHRGEAQKAREEEEESARLELSHLLDSAHEAAETARETLSTLEEQIAVKRKRVADLQAQLAEQRLREIRDAEEASTPQESAQAPSEVEVNSPVGSERRPLLETASSPPPSPTSPASPASPQAPPSPATESGSPGSSPGEGGSPSMESPSGKRVRERMASRRRLEELHRQKSATAEARRGSEQPKSHRLLQTFQTHASATRSVAKAATFESSSSGESEPEVEKEEGT
ncbi:ngb1 [Symbiodinium sp. CCMP2592]|nr:ngb1 [Symbiodinium sp. CCMP2592]